MAYTVSRRGQAQPVPSSLVVRNIVVGGRRTSVRLEPLMWDALREIAAQERKTLHELVTEIARRRPASTLTASIRVFIVDFYRAAARGGCSLAAGAAANSARSPVSA
ncbi:MAG: ribbon-helix-helix domain-containing protein [Alphaproteobacteria bacterium]|nr:ribbon-helix-helix domain-containing protein [Alphaproteobacteria bacterium]